MTTHGQGSRWEGVVSLTKVPLQSGLLNFNAFFMPDIRLVRGFGTLFELERSKGVTFHHAYTPVAQK